MPASGHSRRIGDVRVAWHRMRVLSRLNGWPMRSPVNASPMPSRASAHDWVDAVSYSFIVMDLHHLLLAGPRRIRFTPENGH